MNNQAGSFKPLDRAIIKTLAFFDIFDYPLTLTEIYKWLYQPDQHYQWSDIFRALTMGNLGGQVEDQFGFYYLAGRSAIVRTRLDRYQVAEKKFQIALRTVRWLRWLSALKMIAICNNVGYNNGTAKSDIDFFMVVSKGRLWWARLMITLITTLLGVRRHGVKIVDRVCLSFYTAANHLNLDDISLKPVDPYLVYWFATLAPIYDRTNTYYDFMNANHWLNSYLPNFYPTILTDRRRVVDHWFNLWYQKLDRIFLESFLGSLAERLAKLVESWRVKSYFGEVRGQANTNVVISSDMLKFHKIDRRSQYREVWQSKLNDLNIV